MSIRLSPKHGVNPAIPKCFLCGEDKNELMLLGRLPNDEEAPRGMVWNKEPCDKCVEWMKQGVILISVRTDTKDIENPYRTGGWCVIKDEAVSRMLAPEAADGVLKTRVAFIADDAWDKMGLPRQTQEVQDAE